MFRQDGKMKHEGLASVSALPAQQLELLRRQLLVRRSCWRWQRVR
jgi:hypothetical protein